MSGVDLDRGCTIRIHPSGFRVIMYKDAPGEYLGERGEPMTEAIAAQAGFDVDALGRERAKKKRLDEYRAKVEQEFADGQEELEALTAMSPEGLQVKHIGKGKYGILDEAGNRVTKNPLTKAEAEALIRDMSGGADHGSSS